MKLICVITVLTIAACTPQLLTAVCPCKDDSLCQPVTKVPDKEVLGFVVSKNNWSRYNWTYITTLAMFTDLPSDLMCYAHQKGVRVVMSGNFPIANLSNQTARTSWIETQLKKVQENFADGINIDIEDPTRNGTDDSKLLTQFVSEVYKAFKSANSAYQVTFDIPWSPNCIDGRCYEFDKLVQVTDFLVIMAYDERSQIYGDCIAFANSGYSTTSNGISAYKKLGIQSNRLVLGQPWYGYKYPCIELDDDHVCKIRKVPFRGVECSDAAGTEIPYYIIRELIRNYTAIVRHNEDENVPFFDYKLKGQEYQVWFDEPDSLSLKFKLARNQKLRGLAFWNVDSLDYYPSTPRSEALTAEMWSALDAFFQ